MITELKPNEIFVFGSNLAGVHGGGAARQAHEQFGAEMGVGEGITGQAYAFPTLSGGFERLPLARLQVARNRLYAACAETPSKQFLLTKVGCGIAGYLETTMRGLFVDAPENLILPEDWRAI